MSTRSLFFVGLIYTAHCNPLAQTTVCELAPAYPFGGATASGLNVAGIYSTLNTLGLPGLASPGLGLTSICENIPVAGLGLPGLGYFNPLRDLPLGLPYGLPNLGPILSNLVEIEQLAVPTLPVASASTSVVCESSPNVSNVSPLPLPLPLSLILKGIGGTGLGELGLNLVKSTVPLLGQI